MSKLRRQMEVHMELKNYSPRTRKVYLSALDQFQRHFGKPLQRLGEKHIQEYLHFLIHDRALSQSYVSQTYSALRILYERILKRAWSIDHIPRSKKARRLPVVLTRAEVQAVLQAAPSLRDRAIFATVYSAGLRTSEVAHLKVSDIDSESMRIRVDLGKGAKDRFTLLARSTLTLLRTHWKTCRPPQWLFTPDRRLDVPLSPRVIQKAFQEAVKKAGISKPATVRSLRHSFATHLLDDGVDLYFIKQLLGHANITTTTIYLHLSGKRLSQVTSPIDLWPSAVEGR